MSGKLGHNLSASYYSFYPSHAITPILFIAAGVFAVFITAVNRKDFGKSAYESSSGTGGYLLWMESSLPVIGDMNSSAGRLSLGLDEHSLSGLKFVQMKRSPGNDASCLNLNHITAPPLIGADIEFFLEDNSFSFTKTIRNKSSENPWNLIEDNSNQSVIYGIADQTVLDWGLKINVGDTLILRAENGQPLKIVIAAGLQSSVFQGNVIISKANFSKYYPSVSGNSVFLAKGDTGKSEMYRDVLDDRLSAYGVTIENTADRLGKFYEITNTYLTVFGVFGGLGMITGIAGLGFVVLRNYNRRKREFALMLSAGFSPKKIRKMIFGEQLNILLAGLITGALPALLATLPSLRSNHEIPWLYLSVIVSVIFITGLVTATLPLKSISENNLITALRKD
jgi:putative ABC transport system permease protein